MNKIEEKMGYEIASYVKKYCGAQIVIEAIWVYPCKRGDNHDG